MSLRIAVADDEQEMLDFFEMALQELGYIVTIKAADGQKLVDACEKDPPDLIITDIRMPDMDGLTAVGLIRDSIAIPVILVTGFSDPEYVESALRNHVLAYLIKPITIADLMPAIRLVMQRFKEFQALQQQTEDLRRALEDRKLVERAKGILMQQTGLSEPAAFKRLQLLSSQKNRKLVEIAHMIITANEAFETEA